MNQLLRTKLYLPSPRPTLVARITLVQQLDRALTDRYKLVLLAAPAGFGKTTLLVDWLADHREHVAWLALDEGDNDPARFLVYFVAALRQAHPALSVASEDIAFGTQQGALENVLVALLNDLAAAADYILVILDDYHVIRNEVIHRALTFFLEHLPPHVHLILASRSDPPLPIATLRARGEVIEIRATALRFGTAEATTFLTQRMGLSLSPDQVAALAARTEGWIAGLQLAALSLQQREDVAAFLDSFTGTHRFILEYLTDEILARLSPSRLNFLLQTAILERLQADLCDAVTQRHDGRAMLEQLWQENLFITALDDRGEWYRYHHLFAEILRHHVQHSLRDELAELHHRASTWYAAQHLFEDAIHHALAAGDLEMAAALADRAAVASFLPRQVETLMGWIEQLPAAQLFKHRHLSLYYGWSLIFVGDYQRAEMHLQAVAQQLTASEDTPTDATIANTNEETQAYQGTIAALQTMLAGIRGELDQARQLSAQALQLLPDHEVLWRCLAMAYLGTAYAVNGELAAARHAYGEAMPRAMAAGDNYERLVIAWRLARLEMLQGQLVQAEVALQAILEQLKHLYRVPVPLTGYCQVDLAAIYLEWNRLSEAEESLGHGVALLRQAGSATILLEAYLLRARLCQVAGDGSAAVATLAEAQSLVAKRPRLAKMRPCVVAAQVNLWLAQGNQPAAHAWSDRSTLLADVAAGPIPFDRIPEALALARTKLAQGETRSALPILAHLQSQCAAQACDHFLLQVLLLQALAFAQQQQHDQAQDALTQALHIGQQGGYRRSFLELGEPVAVLLAQVARLDGPLHTFAGDLLRCFSPSSPPTSSTPPTSVPVTSDTNPLTDPAIAQWLVEPLSAREHEVLHLLAKGHTNQEIARLLVISPATAKKHVENIRGKLYAATRTEAIARARELKLL